MTTSEPPSILFVSSVRFFSGSEMLLTEFLKNTHDITPTIVAPDAPLLTRMSDLGYRAHRVGSLSELRRSSTWWWPVAFLIRCVLSFIRLVVIIGRDKPQVVHANNFAAGLYAALPARVMRRPLVWHIYDIFSEGSVESKAIRVMHRMASILVVPSRASRERLLSLGVPSRRVRVIHNGVDCLGRFDPDRYERGTAKKTLGLTPDALVFGVFGQLAELKGLHVLLDAIEIHGDALKDLRLIVVGEAPSAEIAYLDRNKGRVQESSFLRERVTFTGWRRDVPELMRDTDVVVVPSVQADTLPTVVMEAMALGKPVIGSSIGGIPEMIEDGITGYLFAPGDAKELADHLCAVHADPERAKEMGKRARQRALEQFDVHRYCKEILDVYRQVAARN